MVVDYINKNDDSPLKKQCAGYHLQKAFHMQTIQYGIFGIEVII